MEAFQCKGMLSGKFASATGALTEPQEDSRLCTKTSQGFVDWINENVGRRGRGSSYTKSGTCYRK